MQARRFSSIGADGGEIDTAEVGPNAADVLRQLGAILDSPRFRGAVLLRKFLSHCVEETLQGRGDRLKIGNIARDVFGRREDFDNSYDSVVRVNAHRLRQALELYNANEGAQANIQISMKPGSYIPVIDYRLHPLAPSPAEQYLKFVDAYHYSVSGHAYDLAKHKITEGLTEHPEDPELIAGLAEITTDGYHFFGGGWRQIEEARKLFDKAYRLAPSNPRVLVVGGLLSVVESDLAGAAELGRALQMVHKNSSPAFGSFLIELAYPNVADATFSAPAEHTLADLPGWLHFPYFLGHYRRREYESALSEAILMAMPQYYLALVSRAAALAQLGLMQAAHSELKSAVALTPRLLRQPKRLLKDFITRDDDLEHVIDGLQRAGLRQLKG